MDGVHVSERGKIVILSLHWCVCVMVYWCVLVDLASFFVYINYLSFGPVFKIGIEVYL